MWYFHEGMGWWMVFGGIGAIVFWGGLVALIIWGVNRLTRRNNPSRKQTPLDLVKERYARGEITREEFEKIRKDLI